MVRKIHKCNKKKKREKVDVRKYGVFAARVKLDFLMSLGNRSASREGEGEKVCRIIN